jgi:hypothetical protein
VSDFGPQVGIQFAETASGPVAREISDPGVAARSADPAGAPFQISFALSIPRLQDFLGAGVHAAEIRGGTVSWKPDLAAVPVLPGG